jgi:hemerythrin superfamily protein
MSVARTVVSPALRTAFRPQVLRVPLRNSQFASLRQKIAAISTVTDALTQDHRDLERYYKEVVNNPGNHDHQERYGNQFTWELARHSVAEELIIYPAFEKYLGPKGKGIAEKDRKEHHEVRSLRPVIK